MMLKTIMRGRVISCCMRSGNYGCIMNNGSKLSLLKKDFWMNKYIYLMALPIIAYFIIFAYVPMYGVLMAFQKFNPSDGILGSQWVGLKHFADFFSSYYFSRLITNTLVLSGLEILFGFPIPIIFALLMNEVRNTKFKKTVQTITYMPYFISMVVVASLIVEFTSSRGFVVQIMGLFGFEKTSLLSHPEYFPAVYTVSGIWQTIGFNSILYMAALSAINPELYEAATLDRANRWHKIRYITIPGISTTIIIMLILRLGSVMNVGFEKILLLYNPAIYETADVISTFVYRKGLQEFNYGYSTAVGLFNSTINFILLVVANKLSKKFTESSLW